MLKNFFLKHLQLKNLGDHLQEIHPPNPNQTNSEEFNINDYAQHEFCQAHKDKHPEKNLCFFYKYVKSICRS